jgi:pyruvate,water dikinase
MADQHAPPAAASPVHGEAIVELDDPRAHDPALTGGKAAALARARSAGLPTVGGFVLTTAATAAVDRGLTLEDAVPGLEQRWRHLTGDGAESLVVRSSSTVEDQSTDSMAGQFETVVDVRGWDAFREAVDTVLSSRVAASDRSHGRIGPDAPLAVLVQPLVTPFAGGVLFGVDPVTGRSDRVVVSAVEGQPDRLVSGLVEASRYVLTRDGALVESSVVDGGATLDRSALRSLARLASRTAAHFGGPQDMEWALPEPGADVILLQSRPVTTEIRGVPSGPILGTGPVAETFPEPLRRLEVDLWVPPLHDALATSFSLAGAASKRELEQSPLVFALDGVVVVDLELFGEVPMRRSFAARIAGRAHRLRASWRVGRLRSALPDLDRHLLRRIDGLLGAVPPLDQLTSRQLLALLERGRDALRSLHGHEILTSLLVDPHSPRLTASSVALRTLSQARESGASDREIVAEHPVVLSLAPPRIGAEPALPGRSSCPPLPVQESDGDRAAVLREALRLRVRWVQELTGRAAWELGRRLADEGSLVDQEQVVHLHLRDLRMVGTGRAVATDVIEQVRNESEAVQRRERVPARFQLDEEGRPIAVTPKGEGRGGGTGAGGGRGCGPVTHDEHDPPAGSVLVVTTLDPSLGGVLDRLAGLVCETGSVLAHTAILAREAGVPTVVGHHDAVDLLPEGETVCVDGTTGEVALAEPESGR